jgi:hypothetical protein
MALAKEHLFVQPDPDSPAYPIPGSKQEVNAYGLTKREYFATIALQGLLAGGAHRLIAQECHVIVESRFAEVAVNMADALIAELNKS